MILSSFPRRCANCFGATFFLVMGWKLILLLLTAQPIPANDAYFYDGPVVNFLLHGHYCNPTLAIPFPFSANHIYSVYPPFYQAVLYPWMAVFGTSARSAMWFHLALFGAYGFILLGIFRRLGVPAAAVNLAGLFLLGITFDDRPDGLAQLLGMLAIYAWVRSLPAPSTRWPWLAAVCVVLACCTNPEIGGLYLGWFWLLGLGAAGLRQNRLPLAPMLFMTLAPVALVSFIKWGRPDLWAGFMEHASQTPSLTHLRVPSAGELLKLLRTIPALLVIALFLGLRGRGNTGPRWLAAGWLADARPAMLLVSGLLMAVVLAVAGLVVFTANWLLILAHFQPLLVGLFLGLEARQSPPPRSVSRLVLLLMAAVVAVRAVGMTTWGVACALDRSYGSSLQIVRNQLRRTPPESTVVMSSAYLYEAQRFNHLRLINEDWTHRTEKLPVNINGDTLGLLKLRPAALILTQFDYYRRYQIPLGELRALPELLTVTTTNFARLPAPDSFPRFQQVVQHVAWAPVVVQLHWK